MVIQQQPQPLGCFKLFGRELSTKETLTKYAKFENLPITLGRISEKSANDPKTFQFGTHSTISREHARISWDAKTEKFSLQCLSKNGLVLNGNKVEKAESKWLSSLDAIRMGCVCLYFLLPIVTKEPAKDDTDRSNASDHSSKNISRKRKPSVTKNVGHNNVNATSTPTIDNNSTASKSTNSTKLSSSDTLKSSNINILPVKKKPKRDNKK